MEYTALREFGRDDVRVGFFYLSPDDSRHILTLVSAIKTELFIANEPEQFRYSVAVPFDEHPGGILIKPTGELDVKSKEELELIIKIELTKVKGFIGTIQGITLG